MIKPWRYVLFDCEHPISIRNRYTGHRLSVPCGKCSACKLKRLSRHLPALYREAHSWKYCIFFTLTYSDKFLPKVNLNSYIKHVDFKYKKTFQQLCKDSADFIKLYDSCIPVCKATHIQKFIKRFRERVFRKHGHRQIRFAASGDYGSTTFRPHYHGLLFFNDSRLHDNIEEFINQSWSFYNRSTRQYERIGIIDVQDAYSCAKYVSSYVNSPADRPSIYNYRDFRPKLLHSSHPSLGSLVSPVESVKEIVFRGLSEITLYDPITFEYRKTALLPSLVYRLFPRIPAFDRLSHEERLRLYDIFSSPVCSEPIERLRYIRYVMSCNSFLRDYLIQHDLIFNSKVFSNDEAIDRKINTIYYAVSRLFAQCDLLDINLNDYDLLIDNFYKSRRLNSFSKMYDYENNYQITHPTTRLDSLLSGVYGFSFSHVTQNGLVRDLFTSPQSLESSYFYERGSKFNRCIKRKCDNAYLEKHPEFKQFHS